MKTYVKYIDESTIEYAPRNKGSIVNYHLCSSMLKEDGYKELVIEQATSPEKPLTRYRVQGDKVIQYASSYPEPVLPERSEEELQQIKRLERNNRLTWFDWTQLPDNQLTEEERLEYKEYRQYLRDWTESSTEWWNEEIPSFDKWKANKE